MADKPPAKAPSGGPSGDKVFAEVAGVIIVLLLFLPLLSSLAGSFGFFGVVGDTVATIFSYVKLLATIVSMLALLVAVYSFIRISEIAAEETKRLGLALNWTSERKQKNARWERVEGYMTSLNSSDWKIAILEADNILDQVVERMGYKGTTLGERMKHIEASDFPYLEDAWTAHKTRNAIAHKGTDYEISRSEAEQTINIYHRIFKELGYL